MHEYIHAQAQHHLRLADAIVDETGELGTGTSAYIVGTKQTVGGG